MLKDHDAFMGCLILIKFALGMLIAIALVALMLAAAWLLVS